MKRSLCIAGVVVAAMVVAACGPWPPAPPPTTTPPAPQVVQVSAGSQYSCALISDGTVTCWGNNFYGQLGNTTNNGTNDPNPTPTPVAGLTDVTQIAAGERHTCALLDDGTVTCWGANFYGELGTTTNIGISAPIPTTTPTPVAGLTGVTQITAGSAFTCALLEDGTLTCWGHNLYGQLGHTTNSGSNIPNPTPTAVTGLADVTQIDTGVGHSCALLDDGTLTCWGNNLYGQLGNPTNTGTNFIPNPPTAVAGLTGVTQIATGARHTCALLDDSTLTCWGYNIYGQLGNTTNNGTENPNHTPTAVAGLADVTQVGPGGTQTCALLGEGTVTCWGNNINGQLGNTTNNGTNNANPTPAPVAGLTDVTQQEGGNYFGCALLDDGVVVCWGLNLYGQLGNPTNSGTLNPNPTPTPVAGLT